MKIKEITPILERALMAERERCAKIAESVALNSPSTWNHDAGDYREGGCLEIAAAIRALPPPSIKVIRPETAVLHPEKVTSETLIAGQALVDDKIYDARKMRS